MNYDQQIAMTLLLGLGLLYWLDPSIRDFTKGLLIFMGWLLLVLFVTVSVGTFIHSFL